MPKLAKTDPDGFYLGAEPVDEMPDPLPVGRILLPDNHDLDDFVARGVRPQWDAEAKAWRMVHPPTPEEQVEQPHALRAIYLALCALRDGQKLPQETLDWLAWYAKSTDAQG